MATSTSRLAYADCHDQMDRALADGKGIRITFTGRSDDEAFGLAYRFRLRCHSARKMDRKANQAIYASDEPLYGVSVYDKLVLRVVRNPPNKAWVYLEVSEAKVYEAESLSDLESEEIAIEKEPVIEKKPVIEKLWRRI